MNSKIEELMVITMEECGELIQACSKKIRASKPPFKSDLAHDLLIEELGDVQCMMDLIVENGICSYEDIDQRAIKKREKLKKWSNLLQ
tara:strand:+ start:13648 stop:13911 length:264 start_codon:yes stop_codon:yes gene_type:complete